MITAKGWSKKMKTIEETLDIASRLSLDLIGKSPSGRPENVQLNSVSELQKHYAAALQTQINALVGLSDIQSDFPDQLDPTIQSCIMSLQRDFKQHQVLETIRMNNINIQTESKNIHILLNEIKAILKPLAEKQTLSFRVAIDSNVPKTIVIDSSWMREISVELAKNALVGKKNGQFTLYLTMVNHTNLNILFDLEATNSSDPDTLSNEDVDWDLLVIEQLTYALDWQLDFLDSGAIELSIPIRQYTASDHTNDTLNTVLKNLALTKNMTEHQE